MQPQYPAGLRGMSQRPERRPSTEPAGQNVMNDFETGNEVMLLVNGADQAPDVPQLFTMKSFDVFAVDPESSPECRPERAVEQTKKRSLTGAARSDKGDPFAPTNSESNPVEGHLLAAKDFTNRL